MRSKVFILVGVIAFGTSGAVLADVIYDSKGFEEFQEGFIDGQEGQDGWYGFDEGLWPIVWGLPPSQGEKSILLRLPFVEGGRSGMYRLVDDLLAEGYARVTVSFDVYRQPEGQWVGDLTWFWSDYSNPAGGGQYNMGLPLVSRTYPFVDRDDPFTGDAWVESKLDRWASVELTWDYGESRAYGFYDGTLVSVRPIGYVGGFEDFSLDMNLGGAPQDNHQEWAWIDNFIITAEKAACYPDCDGNAALDLFDFLCFVNLFNAGDAKADCTGDGAFDLFDFLCFVNAFNQGC